MLLARPSISTSSSVPRRNMWTTSHPKRAATCLRDPYTPAPMSSVQPSGKSSTRSSVCAGCDAAVAQAAAAVAMVTE